MDLGINSPTQVWNVDKHGTEHSSKTKKVIGKVGMPAKTIQPMEKPLRSTLLTFVNAAGEAVAPMVIHKAKKYSSTWEYGKPDGK